MTSEDLERRVAQLLALSPGGGAFREHNTADDGTTITHQCSYATGTGSIHYASQYVSRFGSLPKWVSVLHPYHRMVLCKLALERGCELPSQRPETRADYLLSSASPAEPTTPRAVRKRATNPLFEMIRATLTEAAAHEEGKAPFRLGGRGHEPRVSLDRRLARVIRGIGLPCFRLSGYGPSLYYPSRVFDRAAASLKATAGQEVLRRNGLKYHIASA